MMRLRVPPLLFAALLPLACAGEPEEVSPPLQTPREAVDGLLEADRAFGASGMDTSATAALAAMFDEGVIMPAGGGFAEGRDSVVAALERVPGAAEAHIEWAPVRAGVSADGQHGFTFGYMTLHRADSTRIPLKYLSYWIRGEEGWRVAAYKRRPRAEGDVSLEMLSPALPPAMVPVSVDSAATRAFAESLRAAEQAFSDEAQVTGNGIAFTRHGSDDAMNLGGPDDAAFVIGAGTIGGAMGLDSVPSPMHWSADRVIVASSGDLGVTFGVIRLHEPPADPGAPSAFPFFTVWRRATPADPWRYIAE